jgi:electron transfer flavoprotein alpha subunit
MPGTIAVVAECQGRGLHPATWDAIALAQRLNPERLVVIAPGAEIASLATAFEGYVHEFWQVQDPRLGTYSAELHCSILHPVIDDLAPAWVVIPHTYQGRDFAPKLAARHGRSLIADCTGVIHDANGALFTRPLFQGRLSARVRATGQVPHFVTVQPGCCAPDCSKLENNALRIRQVTPRLDGAPSRTVGETPQRSAQQGVDLTQATAIVAIGRGIGSAANVDMARRLAELLGAELAASRPVCDEGWLPIERQIGSSGITVSPKLYVAIGISGAIQHLAGMKGAGTIVAINKDANAPIFRVADIGVVGDLHEIVPALIQALESRPNN